MSEKDYDSDASSGDEEPTTAQDIVVTKYNMGAEIVNAVLKDICGRCKDGQSIGELIDLGDQMLQERASKDICGRCKDGQSIGELIDLGDQMLQERASKDICGRCKDGQSIGELIDLGDQMLQERASKDICGRCKDGQSIGELIDLGDQMLQERASKVTLPSFTSLLSLPLKDICGRCKDGQSIGELIDLGDQMLQERASKLFKKDKKMKKGIAFPTCISVNNCICHFSPLKSEPDKTLKDGDVVKVDMGVHMDGFIATAAHTVVVGASKENKMKGRVADAILGAYNAMEAAIRMLRPEAANKNTDVTDVISKVADAYKVKPVENMLSHQLTRHKIDGEKQIIQAPGEKERQSLEKCEFENHDVFAIDILFSTGEGKAREGEQRTTVYKKADDLVYQLKMKMSRIFLSEVDKKFGVHPFSLRRFENEAQAKMGVGECERHGLMKPYQVLWEREGETVVQFKATVLVMPNGLLKITGLPLETELYESEHKVTDPKLALLIASSLKPKNKKAKAKSKEGAEAKATA